MYYKVSFVVFTQWWVFLHLLFGVQCCIMKLSEDLHIGMWTVKSWPGLCVNIVFIEHHCHFRNIHQTTFEIDFICDNLFISKKLLYYTNVGEQNLLNLTNNKENTTSKKSFVYQIFCIIIEIWIMYHCHVKYSCSHCHNCFILNHWTINLDVV